jgi:hypothetical protein
MVDHRLLLLLHECDQYLARQQVLLDRATALGVPPGSAVAMEAAADQLATAVGCTWRMVLADAAPPSGAARDAPPDEPSGDRYGTEPGE